MLHLPRSLDDPELDDYVPDASPVDITFEKVAGGTKRGGRKLVSSDGYCYTVKVSFIYILFLCLRAKGNISLNVRITIHRVERWPRY